MDKIKVYQKISQLPEFTINFMDVTKKVKCDADRVVPLGREWLCEPRRSGTEHIRPGTIRWLRWRELRGSLRQSVGPTQPDRERAAEICALHEWIVRERRTGCDVESIHRHHGDEHGSQQSQFHSRMRAYAAPYLFLIISKTSDSGWTSGVRRKKFRGGSRSWPA